MNHGLNIIKYELVFVSFVPGEAPLLGIASFTLVTLPSPPLRGLRGPVEDGDDGDDGQDGEDNSKSE